ncbi:unnamed protein product [Brassica oleracea]
MLTLDDESADVVISSLRLGGDQGSLLTYSDWFTFQDDRFNNTTIKNMNMNGNSNANNSSSDDEVMVGEEDNNDLTEKPKNINLSTSISTSENNNVPSEMQVTSSVLNPSIDVPMLDVKSPPASAGVRVLFEEDVEFVGVEAQGTEKSMEQALKECIVGEAEHCSGKLKPGGDFGSNRVQ